MSSKKQQRFSLSLYFFLSGFGFATWASRIPTIKTFFDLNEAQLGNLLLAMPVSSLIGLPISGWLVSRFDSRKPLLVSFLFFSAALMFIGFAEDLLIMILAIGLFSFSMRILNISMNTQSLTLQRSYHKRIIGSFHGLWSAGGLAGVGCSTLMIHFGVSMETHLAVVGGIFLLAAGFAYQNLLKKDRAKSGNKLQLRNPDKFILYLGFLIFFAAVCEGGMFDWSGVFFKEVVKEETFTLGYFIFMLFMAVSRFFTDRLIERFGMQNMFLLSGSIVSAGILLMVLFPVFWPAIIGFSLVGFGVAAIIPMIYALAGTSKKYSPGMAVSIIATYGIIGMLLGPPIIGYLAHLFNLKIAFLLLLLCGLMQIPISRKFFKLRTAEEQE